MTITNKQVPGRFDYTKYDEQSTALQAEFKAACQDMETLIDTRLHDPRYKALALIKLEEFYMYVGKAVRNDQYARSTLNPLQEDRGNS
jgi:hypothetical protein